MNGYKKMELFLEDKNRIIDIFKKHSIGCPDQFGLNKYCGGTGCNSCWEKTVKDNYRHSNPNRRTTISGFGKIRLFFNNKERAIKYVTDNTRGCPSYYGLKDFCDNGCSDCWKETMKHEYE